MADAAGLAVGLSYGTLLIWGGVTAIRVLGSLVIAPRPASFVRLRLAAIWSVGVSSILIGAAVAAQGLGNGI
ncbi:MAG TPA: hypothetical protein VLS25_05035 [Dehalococcoidia bacterium]|nr:hypothetical protein [Dehalococcoidia bacterium]